MKRADLHVCVYTFVCVCVCVCTRMCVCLCARVCVSQCVYKHMPAPRYTCDTQLMPAMLPFLSTGKGLCSCCGVCGVCGAVSTGSKSKKILAPEDEVVGLCSMVEGRVARALRGVRMRVPGLLSRPEPRTMFSRLTGPCVCVCVCLFVCVCVCERVSVCVSIPCQGVTYTCGP
jgi:hypothetical protein